MFCTVCMTSKNHEENIAMCFFKLGNWDPASQQFYRQPHLLLQSFMKFQKTYTQKY